MNKLLRAISKLPAPPCEKYRCGMAISCAANALACKSFQSYAAYGIVRRPIRPTRAIYAKIYDE